MRRKFLSVVLCVCMMLTMAPFAFAADEQESSGGSSAQVAEVNGTNYTSLDDAVANATGENNTVKLLTNVTLSSQLTIDHSITLDGAGYTITATGTETWSGNNGKHLLLITSNNVTIENTTFNCADLAYDVHVYKATGVTFNNVTIKNSVGAALGVNASSVTATGNFATECSTWKNSVNICWGSSITDTDRTCSFNASNATLTGVRSVYADTDDVSHATSTSKFTFTSPNNSSSWKNIVSDNTAIKYVNYDNAVAQVGDTRYDTLAAAVAAIKSSNQAGTIELLRNVSERLWIRNNEDVTLNLNGYTLSSEYQTANVRHGKLTVNGPGTIKEDEPYFGALLIKGSTNQNDTDYAVATINKGVTLEGWAAVFIDQFDSTTNNKGKAYGITVNLNGAVLNGKKDTDNQFSSCVYVNGNITDATNAPTIKLDSTTITSEGHGMYLAGYTNTTVTNSSIIGSQTGIEIRAGKLNVNNTTVTGNGDFSCTPNDNGSTTNGVGVAIAQHTTKLPTEVTISGGTISGKYAVYESNPQNNDSTSIGNVKLSITDGKFNGSTAAVYSQDVTKFITGGLFTTDPTAYCGTKEGKQLTGIPSNNSNYPFTVRSVEQNVEVAPAQTDAKTANTTDMGDAERTAVTSAATAAAGTTATGLDAIGGTEATKVTSNDVTTATQKLKTAGVNTDAEGTTVTLYVQPYLDITVTGADVTTSSEGAASTINSLSLNIIPMVKKVASTATSAENIELNPSNETGKTKNATVISTTEVKNVNTPVTITLPLPSGFASSTTDKLSIKHTKANGSVEYYTGTVTSAATGQGEDAVTTYYVTFTTNGFSPFVIYAASANVASIGDNVYPSLQAAIDAVQDNQTITLLKDTDENVTVSKAVKFTLDTTSSNFTGSITAGSRYTLTQSGNTYTVTRQSSSSSGSISAPTTYNVNVNAATNGAVAADKKTASKGTTVTVTASPSKGYVVDAVKVVDKDGKDVAVTEKDGKYVFTMPASAVTVTGSFKAETPAPVALPFSDVKSGNWFYDAVKYAYEQGLMTGTSATTFAPNGTMNRAMIVTVLYRLEKSPAVTGASKFTDVPAGQWYSDAVAWAAANKIVNGYDETTFGPMNAVTREQMAAILFRYEQYKGLENVTLEENLNRFPDQNKISAYAIPALQWAVGQKIINGNANGTLDPTGTATRAQVAQIFTNLLNK